MQHEPTTIRSVTNRVYAIGIWVLLAALATAIAVGGGTGVAALPTLAYLAALAWIVLWRPHLVVDDDGATVANPFTHVRVPFEALIDVSTKWALTLVTPERRVAVFCAPQPGRFVSWRVQRRIRREGDTHERGALERGVHVGALPGTESGDAAALVRERWQRALDDGRVEIGAAEHTMVRPRLDALALCVTLGGAIAAVGAAAAIAAWI